MGFGIGQTWLDGSCMLLAGRPSKRTSKLASNSEMNFTVNEKNDNKEVVPGWRMNLWEKKSLFSKYEVWADVITCRWKCVMGS